jgi:hypothetical protein
VAELDYSSLEKVSGSFVSEDLRNRENDIIWRVRWGTDWLYVYLLLEFQSTVDRYMAVRIASYVSLLYQDLIRNKHLTPKGLLPPVVPIVLYNGAQRWTAREELADLVEPMPGLLARYRPNFRYLLVDEGRYDDFELSQTRNVVAALFRLEFSREPSVITEVLGALIQWVELPSQASLRRALTTWVVRVLKIGQIPGVDLDKLHDLSEVKICWPNA